MSVLMVKQSPMASNVLTVEFTNGKLLGEFYREVDGYYVFDPESGSGYWPEWLLRALADELEELNKEWNEQVEREINSGANQTF